MTVFDTTALSVAEIAPHSVTGACVETRSNIFEMTQAAEEAVLRPKETGPWSHPLRAGLAARIARLNGEEALAERYYASADTFAALADPAQDGSAQGLRAVVAFMDKVAAQTRDVTAEDVSNLQASGVADADIVRLAELNAFLGYQCRVIAGLRLIGRAE